jgi:hypothetical protein
MFAFKNEKPDAARLYHERLTAAASSSYQEGRRFFLTPKRKYSSSFNTGVWLDDGANYIT